MSDVSADGDGALMHEMPKPMTNPRIFICITWGERAFCAVNPRQLRRHQM